MTTPDLTGALCVGQWELFDSQDLISHHEAAAICAECPVRAACETVLQATKANAAGTGTRHGSGPQGTWAGQLIAPRPEAQCGTESGYARHRRNRETPCADCKRGRNAKETIRARARRTAAA
jgi:hypothetical protein